MTLFIIFASILIVLALFITLPVLLRGERTDAEAASGANLRFLRSRLKELEDQLAVGKLTTDQYSALKEDLQTNLAAEMETNAATPNQEPNQKQSHEAKHKLARLTAVGLLVLIPLSAALTYWSVGNPNSISLLAQSETGEDQIDMAQVQVMIEQIESRLQENPNDLEGWLVLAQTYLGLGRFANAERAYLQVLQLEGPNAATYAALGDASALANQGQLVGRPIDYINKALELDSKHPQALWLAGLHAVQVGDSQAAKDYWLTLMPLLDNLPEQQSELRDILAEIEKQTLVANAPGQPNSTTDRAKAKSSETASTGVALQVSVTIDNTISSKVTLADTVFVIVRAVDGPRAPLAVKRYTVSSLPETIVLTDKDAMVAGNQLSSFNELEVLARISKNGQAIPQAGDLTSSPVITTLSVKQDIAINIDREI